jgi:hypothetical protein
MTGAAPTASNVKNDRSPTFASGPDTLLHFPGAFDAWIGSGSENNERLLRVKLDAQAIARIAVRKEWRCAA